MRRLRPLTLADLLDGMVDLFVAHWRTYVLVLGPIVLPLSIVTAWLQTEVYGGAGLLQQITDPATTDALFAGGPATRAFGAAVVLSLVSALLISPLLYGSACRIAASGYTDGDPGVAGAFSATWRRYPSLVAVTALVMLLVGVIVGVPAVLMVLGGMRSEPPLVAAGAVGMVLAFPLAAAVAVRYSLAYPAAVVERLGPTLALRRSRNLVRGQFWRVLGVVGLGLFIATVVAQIVALPLSIPGDAWGALLGVALISVGTAISSLLMTPLVANLLTLLYFDGRIRKEGYDLERVIDALDVPEPAVG